MEREIAGLDSSIMEEEVFINRMQLLNLFARYKRNARVILAGVEEMYDEKRQSRRQKHVIEAQKNPFNAERLASLDCNIKELDADCVELRRYEMAFLGPWLIWLCDKADLLLNEHDKAQVLGISHIRLQNVIQRYAHLEDEISLKMLSLVFMYHAEHHPDKDFVDPQEDQMPLWQMAYWYMHESIKNSPELKQKMHEKIEKWSFENQVPMYRMEIGLDGERHLRRLPPKLKVVH